MCCSFFFFVQRLQLLASNICGTWIDFCVCFFLLFFRSQFSTANHVVTMLVTMCQCFILPVVVSPPFSDYPNFVVVAIFFSLLFFAFSCKILVLLSLTGIVSNNIGWLITIFMNKFISKIYLPVFWGKFSPNWSIVKLTGSAHIHRLFILICVKYFVWKKLCSRS